MSPTSFKISPLLLNSASPWATNLEDLNALYNCTYTGAITTRTSLLKGFKHDSKIHQYAFFSPAENTTSSARLEESTLSSGTSKDASSLNTLGYSPLTLQEYLEMIDRAASGMIPNFQTRQSKPIIVSVTGSADEVAQCYTIIAELQAKHLDVLTLLMEINLSCPNIPDKPPPAYDEKSLANYLSALAKVRAETDGLVLAGIKTPPYTYQGQYDSLISALKMSVSLGGGCPIAFITATNTLGSCLLLDYRTRRPTIASATGEGIGGMAGASLHLLALGNVKIIRKMLDANDELKSIQVIGVGGVSDGEGCERMLSVGAVAVAVATGLGREGVDVFQKISQGLERVKIK